MTTDQNTTTALDRLISLALSNSSHAPKAADFLLSWFNAGAYGGFDLTMLWAVDSQTKADMIEVFSDIAAGGSYPAALGYAEEFQVIADKWRPNRG